MHDSHMNHFPSCHIPHAQWDWAFQRPNSKLSLYTKQWRQTPCSNQTPTDLTVCPVLNLWNLYLHRRRKRKRGKMWEEKIQLEIIPHVVCRPSRGQSASAFTVSSQRPPIDDRSADPVNSHWKLQRPQRYWTLAAVPKQHYHWEVSEANLKKEERTAEIPWNASVPCISNTSKAQEKEKRLIRENCFLPLHWRSASSSISLVGLTN